MVKGTCVICRIEGLVDNHHTSYDPEHIIVVCKNCHVNLHKYKMAPSQPLRRVHLILQEHQYEELTRLKKRWGLTWEDFVTKLCEYGSHWDVSDQGVLSYSRTTIPPSVWIKYNDGAHHNIGHDGVSWWIDEEMIQ